MDQFPTMEDVVGMTQQEMAALGKKMGDELARELTAELTEELAAEDVGGTSRKRSWTDRKREEGQERLMADYFAPNPIYSERQFRRRFRMSKALFIRIMDALSGWYAYFRQRPDALGKAGFTPHQKCTASLRQLCYGSGADSIDEYL
jgi:hypothetical protein